MFRGWPEAQALGFSNSVLITIRTHITTTENTLGDFDVSRAPKGPHRGEVRETQCLYLRLVQNRLKVDKNVIHRPFLV